MRRPRSVALSPAVCAHIQEWLSDYLSTDIDPYDFNFAISDWIEQEEIEGFEDVEPTDVSPDDLNNRQTAAFIAWLKKSGEADLYKREMPYESPAYLTLHAERNLPAGSWFIHFTSATFDKFDRGATLEGLHLSTWSKRKDLANCAINLSRDQGPEEVVFGFAFSADRLGTSSKVRKGSRRYGSNAVLFQCDCAVEAWHDGDEEFQSIFPVCSEYNLHAVSINNGRLAIKDDGGNDREFDKIDDLIAHLEGQRVVSAPRAPEEEPRTMARVQALVEETFPGHRYTVWIEREEPRRHVSVRFDRVTVEGAGSTWLEAISDVKRQRGGARTTSMRASEGSNAPSILIKAGEVDLYMDDGNTIVFPSDYGMAHDVSGRSLDECSLFFGPVKVTQESVDEVPEEARAYFGDDYDAKIAVIDVPTQGWNLVGHVEEIVYFRPGKYEEVWRHPFESPQPLYRSRDWFQMKLPTDCVLTWKGIERP